MSTCNENKLFEVGESGIWVRIGLGPNYKLVLTKEVFVEAYNKYIKESKEDDRK